MAVGDAVRYAVVSGICDVTMLRHDQSAGLGSRLFCADRAEFDVDDVTLSIINVIVRCWRGHVSRLQLVTELEISDRNSNQNMAMPWDLGKAILDRYFLLNLGNDWL